MFSKTDQDASLFCLSFPASHFFFHPLQLQRHKAAVTSHDAGLHIARTALQPSCVTNYTDYPQFSCHQPSLPGHDRGLSASTSPAVEHPSNYDLLGSAESQCSSHVMEAYQAWPAPPPCSASAQYCKAVMDLDYDNSLAEAGEAESGSGFQEVSRWSFVFVSICLSM